MAERILIIKPGSLGDVVHALPAVAAIRDANAEADITWLIQPEWAPLLRGNPDIDHVHLFPRDEFRGLRGTIPFLGWLGRIRKVGADVALDFQGLLRSALIARASRANRIVGMSDAREGSRLFYRQIARVDRNAHAVDRYLKLASEFGAPVAGEMRFAIPTGDQPPRFDPFPAFIVLHPYARGARKSLSRSLIEEFCHALAPARVVIVGKSDTKFSVPDNCVNLTNETTLLQLVWLLRNAAFVISVDSGPMHIAAAVTINLVGIHTWSDPRRVGPYNTAAWVWKNGRLMRVAELDQIKDFGKPRRFHSNDIKPIADVALQVLAANPAAEALY